MAGLYSMPALSLMKVSTFKGIDCSVPEDQMQPYRAVDAENMMPDAMGEVRKRPGVVYEKKITLTEGETVVEMIGGKHPVILVNDAAYQGYKLYHCSEETGVFRLMYFSDIKPVAQQYGDEWIVFCRCLNADQEQGRGYAFGNHAEAVVFIFAPLNEITAYDDNGYRYDVNESTLSRQRIKNGDPRLTTPQIVKGAKTSGGATPFQEVNLLNPWVTESFCTDAEGNCVFYLLDEVEAGADADTVYKGADLAERFEVKVLVGVEEEDVEIRYEWRDRAFDSVNDAFRPSANRLFLSPEQNKALFEGVKEGFDADWKIGISPKEGEDNVQISHLRAGFREGFRRICEAACTAVFGVGGHKDRLFLGGNRIGVAGYHERVYYSELEDPLYIGEHNYIRPDDGAEVRAMDGTGDSLAVITDKGIYLAQATAQDTASGIYADDAVVTTSAVIPAPAPIGYGNTAVLGGEVVYLSERGVVAVVYEQKYNERYAEYRSSLIERRLMEDRPTGLLTLGRYLLIRCADGVCWLLDENQPNKEGNRPYASHQYEGFRLTGMFMDAAWADGNVLRLVYGSSICRWTLNGDEVYYDNYTADEAGKTAINAFWETPYFYGTDLKKRKKFKRLGVLLGTVEGADTAVQVEGQKNEEDWKVLWEYDGNLCSFSYPRLDYRLFTYSGKAGLPITARKIKVKKAYRFKLRFSNRFINHPLILREFSLDYAQED